jgi:zinc transporter ZupT
MKSPFLQALTSTLSRLDPIYPRPGEPHGVHHEAAGHAEVGHAEGSHGAGGDGARLLGMGPAQYAFFLAVLSGLSLPVGAMLGVKLKPHDTTIARWIAIGAGALLFAVAVELYGHSIHSYSAGHTEKGPMIILLAMSLFGSYLFTYLAQAFEGEEDSDDESSEDEEAAPGASASRLKPTSHGKSFDSDSPAKNGGQPTVGRDVSGEAGVVLTPGELEHHHHHHHGSPHGTVPSHKVGRGLGAIVRQIEEHRKWKAQKRWAHLREAMKKYHIITFLQKQTELRKRTEDFTRSSSGLPAKKASFVDKSSDFWKNMKEAWQNTQDSGPNQEKLSKIASKSRAAAMSMLIMLIVDGIPEGILMGFMAAGGTLGFTFVLALVIANFPEGFAGGQLMNQADIPMFQIFLAWAGPMMLTATGAAIACYMLLWLSPPTGGHNTPYGIQVLVCATEGVAGGAMISGIAATMLPEAYERRDKEGGILGSGGFLCTFGFLMAFGIKVALD